MNFYYQLDVSKAVSRNYGFQAIAYLQGYTWFKQLFCLMLKKLKPEKSQNCLMSRKAPK